jgi:glycosyltransferase involved in cell wall biosynthesis
LLAAAETLLDNESWRAELGARARAYAEATFDAGAIAERFETVLEEAAAGS